MLQDPENPYEEWSDEVWAVNIEAARKQCQFLAGDDLTDVLDVTQRTKTPSKNGTFNLSVGLERRNPTMAVSTAAIQGIKQLSYPPAPGEHYLSVNLALADPAEVWEVAKNLNFKPELVQIDSRFGIEIHALLFHELTNGEPMNSSALDTRIDALADRINTSAIRHTYGGRMIA